MCVIVQVWCVCVCVCVRNKGINVTKNILCNLSFDPEIRHAQLYAVYFRELVISFHSLSLFLRQEISGITMARYLKGHMQSLMIHLSVSTIPSLI